MRDYDYSGAPTSDDVWQLTKAVLRIAEALESANVREEAIRREGAVILGGQEITAADLADDARLDAEHDRYEEND